MARRRHTPEQIIRRLREADRLLGEGADGRAEGPGGRDGRCHTATAGDCRSAAAQGFPTAGRERGSSATLVA
jgi:hypothetical protein